MNEIASARFFGFIAIALLLSSRPAGAQTSAMSRTAPAPRTIARPASEITSAVTVAVSSDALTVVTVPVPSRFGETTEPVRYAVIPGLPGAIVGQLSGLLTPPSAQQSILFAVRIPRRLSAGRIALATVSFYSAGISIDVPVIAEVAAHAGVTISFPMRLIAGRSGLPVRIPWRLTNTGNAPDTLRMTPIVPAGWRLLSPLVDTPLNANESADGMTDLLPPPQAQGRTTIRFVAQSRAIVLAEASIDVQIAGGEADISTVNGPRLRASAALAAGPWPGTSTMQSLELQGPISDGLTVRARASTTPNEDAANYALSRADMAAMPFAFQLAAPSWRFDAGTLGSTVSDLTGANLVGRGASLAIAQPSWRATAVAMSPDLGFVDAGGSLAASRFEVDRGPWSLASSFSRLRETRSQSIRALDAFALGGSLNNVLGGRFAADVAHRQFDGGSGPGWGATYLRRTPDESFDVRYVHAPGGSRAFARAADELSVNASRRLSERIHLSGGAWRSADDAPSLSALRMSGWTFGLNVDLDRGLQVIIGGHESGFDAHTSLGAFGSGERGVDATVDVRRGWWSAQLTGLVANLERTTTVADTTMRVLRQSAARGGGRGALTLGTFDKSSLSLTGHYERTGPGVGAAPEQWSYGFRLTARPSLGYRRPVRVELNVERVGGSYDAVRSLMVQAGVELELPFHSSLIMSAEQNPFLLPAPGASQWMYVVGISRSLSLPRISRRGTRGVVYRDVNGNGRRETGESGLAGVMLRRGADVAVTDAKGSFRLPGDHHAPYEIEARSMPLGLISPSTAVAAGTRDIGVVSVSLLEVELALDPADSARVLPERLAELVVSVRDSAGRDWASRRVSASRVVFDAIPPGTYTVIVDATASHEPLRPTSDLRTVVATGRATTFLRVVMKPRPLRFSNPRRRP